MPFVLPQICAIAKAPQWTQPLMPAAQSYWEIGVAHFQHSREQVFDKIKGKYAQL